MTLAIDPRTDRVIGQLLEEPAGYRGSVPGWLRILTRDGVKRIANNGSVRLEAVR